MHGLTSTYDMHQSFLGAYLKIKESSVLLLMYIDEYRCLHTCRIQDVSQDHLGLLQTVTEQ